MSERYRPMFGVPVSEWYRWFAWRPVQTLDRGWRWLRPVWRRRVMLKPSLPGSGMWFQSVVGDPNGQ